MKNRIIICYSPDDEIHRIETAALAEKWGCLLVDASSRHLMRRDDHSIPVSLGQFTELYLQGHGNKIAFGEQKLSPTGLVADLIAFGLSPATKKIYIVSCGVGEQGDTPSFIETFTEELHARNYDPMVYAFTNKAFPEALTAMQVQTRPNENGGYHYFVAGISPAEKPEFDEGLRLSLAIEPSNSWKNETTTLFEEKLTTQQKIRELKLDTKADNTAALHMLNERLATIDSQYKKTSQKLDHIKNVVYKTTFHHYEKTLSLSDDAIRTLENNANFHHSHAIFANAALLSEQRRSILVSLNNRIADLKENAFCLKNSGGFTYFFKYLTSPSLENITHQIQVLTHIADLIRDPHTLPEIISRALYAALEDSKLDDSPVIEYLGLLKNH